GSGCARRAWILRRWSRSSRRGSLGAGGLGLGGASDDGGDEGGAPWAIAARVRSATRSIARRDVRRAVGMRLLEVADRYYSRRTSIIQTLGPHQGICWRRGQRATPGPVGRAAELLPN